MCRGGSICISPLYSLVKNEETNDGTSSHGGGQTKNMTYTEKCHDILHLVHTGIFGQVTFCGVHPKRRIQHKLIGFHMVDDTRQRSDLPYNQHLHNPRVYFASSILNLIKSSQSLSQNYKNYGSIDRRFLDHITIGHRPLEQCHCVYQHGTIETMGHGPIVIVILQITAFHGH